MHAIKVLPGCLLALTFGLVAAQPKPAPGNIQFEREGASAALVKAFPPATFPHWRHRINYRCDACHDSIFKMQRGANVVSMDRIQKGEVCGTCHNGEVAFAVSFENCNRCHVATGK